MARRHKKLIIYHTYKKGECLNKIAKKYNISVNKIANDNGITNVDFLIQRTENQN